jgi:hypothetical protein
VAICHKDIIDFLDLSITSFAGNVAAKRRKVSPFESHTKSKIASKTGSLMEAPASDAKLSARPPNHSGKIKLQLFPLYETIQEIMQQVSTSAPQFSLVELNISTMPQIVLFEGSFSLIFALLITSCNVTGKTQSLP